MITIAVCEDERADLEMICHYIQQYGEINQYEFKIVLISSGKDFWDDYAYQKYDLLFLDIYLEDTTGIDIAKNLRKMNDDSALVFITSSKTHAVEGFEIGALHYLLKPITRDLVFEAMKRCEGVLKKDRAYISIYSGKLERRISLKDIVYIEVFDKVSIIYTMTEALKTYCSLSQLEKQLGGDPFLRCHRCSIINMLYVEDLTPTDFIMKNGNLVAIRKMGSVEIRQYYLDFIFERIRGENFGS